MFVKLKKKDGSPVWVNAGYVVTVTPAKFGGSTVVPIGDGFDYDVMEEPEEVVSLLSGAALSADEKPKRKTRKKKADGEGAVSPEEPPPPEEEKPAAKEKPSGRKPARKKQAAALEEGPESVFGEAASAPAAEDVLAEKLKFDFPEEYIARLRKLAPGSIRKLNNTLVAQCNVTDPGPVVMYLVDRHVIALDKSHVVWLDDPSANPDNMADMVFG